MTASPTLPLAPPSGMEDHLPDETRVRASLVARLLGLFESFGYERVITPAFEHADVLERGLEIDRRDLLRFVEPETGEVALLRPDITPQIARIVATRLGDRPPPWRLSYHGTVLRQRQRSGRARTARQRTQVGVEHIGTATRRADVEVIELAIEACRAAGLEHFRVELGHVGVPRWALEPLPEPIRSRAATALARKDVALLESHLTPGALDPQRRGALLALAELYGEADIIARARRVLTDDGSRAALDELEAVRDALAERGHADVLQVDLGDLRGHGYYTGVSFSVLAEGPGEPLGAGGRYDRLLGRFGAPAPATGFALDLGHLIWALRHSGAAHSPPRSPRVVAVDVDDAWVDALRAAGVQVATLPEGGADSALAFARAWKYDAALVADVFLRVADGDRLAAPPLAEADIPALTRWWLGHEE